MRGPLAGALDPGFRGMTRRGTSRRDWGAPFPARLGVFKGLRDNFPPRGGTRRLPGAPAAVDAPAERSLALPAIGGATALPPQDGSCPPRAVAPPSTAQKIS